MVLALGLAAAAPLSAQEPLDPGEVGISEHLDAQVPLDLALVDESGATVALRSLVDRPTLLTFNYYRCAGICTPQLNGVAKLLGRIALTPGEAFRVLTVSFDARDTAEIAQKKRANYLKTIDRPVVPAAWRFLTGSAGATRALADAVGFKFKRQGDDFVHAAVIVVLSPQGRVTRYLHGVHYLPADVQMAVDEAAAGLARPTIAKWVAFCYSYDPQSRRYALSVTRLAGVALIAGLSVFAAIVVFKGRGRAGQGGARA
jgi:protein SCO1/2